MNPPDLLEFSGDWSAYEKQLYRIFLDEIAHGGLEHDGWPIRCRRHPESHGRWAAFWHLIQEGDVEDDRLPDLRRCERLRWIRWIIENQAACAKIEAWGNYRGTERNLLFWFNEEYLVVITKRSEYWLLKTAYCTERSGRIAQLRRERDGAKRE